MNAPLSSVSELTPEQTYEQVSRVTHEVAGRLAQRLRQETQGEVGFTAGDRARYATDASIYQVMPVGVFVPRHADEVGVALDDFAEGVFAAVFGKFAKELGVGFGPHFTQVITDPPKIRQSFSSCQKFSVTRAAAPQADPISPRVVRAKVRQPAR